MSKDSAAKFWKRLNSDEAFLRALSEPGADRPGIIKRAGFDFKIDELAALLRRRSLFGIVPEHGSTLVSDIQAETQNPSVDNLHC